MDLIMTISGWLQQDVPKRVHQVHDAPWLLIT